MPIQKSQSTIYKRVVKRSDHSKNSSIEKQTKEPKNLTSGRPMKLVKKAKDEMFN